MSHWPLCALTRRKGCPCGAEPMQLDGEEPDGAEAQARAAALADNSSAALQARQTSHAEASTSQGSSRTQKLTSLTIEALRDTVTAFFRGMPKACANCGAELPDIKRCAHGASGGWLASCSVQVQCMIALAKRMGISEVCKPGNSHHF